MTLGRLWAGWRMAYVSAAGEQDAPETSGGDVAGCVLCRIVAGDEPDDQTHVVRRTASWVAVLNAFPYASGHLMVVPVRHVGELEELSDGEAAALWRGVTGSVVALKSAYRPEGINVGFNLGRAAGAGIPGHLHAHVVPRWNGDTNFMTALAEVRVLPEALPDTWARLRRAWPDADSASAAGD